VSVDAEVSCNGGRFRENLLFTHRGLSGPAILQVSSYWNGGDLLHVDLLPGLDARAWLVSERSASAGIAGLLAQRLPHRFAQQWTLQHGNGLDTAGPIRSLGEKRLREIGTALNDWALLPSGTLGYNKAEGRWRRRYAPTLEDNGRRTRSRFVFHRRGCRRHGHSAWAIFVRAWSSSPRPGRLDGSRPRACRVAADGIA
jgi:hypothetical protein